MATDIEIARAAKLEPILKIAEKIGIPAEAIEPYGTKIGKIDLGFLAEAQERAKSRAEVEAHPRHRHQPDGGRRRQDDDLSRPRRCAAPCRQEERRRPA